MNAVRAWLARPLGWFTFVLAEYLIAIATLRAVLPADTTLALGLPVLIAVIGGMFVLNMRIRRWLADPGRDR